ncbi:MAG TPA: hypothetical protein VFM50_06485 [Nocardioidaceae bacterium]|jgi:hypothetical protein|nr:hypothetical protein [Nocardioidaceae bacterium]
MWFLIGAVAFVVGMGVLGNRRRRGGAGSRDRFDRAAAQGQAEAHLRGNGANISGPGFP